ncbi:MAG: F-box-like [Chlamydiales bacterium]|jgi:hypothetical protein|nr:F-box-like [Chlamydiales bacterium]
MSPIDSLPNELLSQIFSYGDLAALSSVRLVSRRWQELIDDPQSLIWQPHLEPEAVYAQFYARHRLRLSAYHKKRFAQEWAHMRNQALLAALAMPTSFYALAELFKYLEESLNLQESYFFESASCCLRGALAFFIQIAAMTRLVFLGADISLKQMACTEAIKALHQALPCQRLIPCAPSRIPLALMQDAALSQNQCALSKQTVFFPVRDRLGRLFEYSHVRINPSLGKLKVDRLLFARIYCTVKDRLLQSKEVCLL